MSILLTFAYTFLFFFYCSAHHRDLHSFPTRRSSDLRCRRQHSGDRSGSAARDHRRPDRRTRRGHRDRSRGIRSEEHTSELQSLRHLVCRLLLEKKKKKKQITKIKSRRKSEQNKKTNQ